MTTTERMKELIATLLEADIAYYRDDRPIMSDFEYDKLTNELISLENETGIILSGSPTQKVSGDVLEGLEKVTHTKPMLSAGKTKNVEDLVKFAKNKAVMLSWKMDGLTIVLRYEDGHFKQAITRGRDGIIGEDVTHNVKNFINIPLTVPITSPFEVRGEGVVSGRNFNTLNETLDDPYLNARNFASGQVRKLNAKESLSNYLEFFAFDLVSDYLEPEDKVKQQILLRNNGFTVVPFISILETHSDENVRTAIAAFNPKSFDYPVDGLVMEYTDVKYAKSLGATGHHENRLIALKWQDEQFETKFRGVELATTRTGMVSITGVFDPVVIDGTTVSRAYLHNVDIFDEFQFGIGDNILVYKANMIIPQISDNLTQSNTFTLPMVCPCCGMPLEAKKTTGGTRQLFCVNPKCPAKLVQKFEHFCEKTRMNIDGLSATTLEKFINHGWIKTFGDIYNLERFKDEIVSTEGFGERSYEKLRESIEKSRHCTLAKFIAGLGIPLVGRHAGKIIDEYYNGSWDEFEFAIKGNADFSALPDFGKTMSDSIYTWYNDKEEALLWRPLLKEVVFESTPKAAPVVKTNPFYGKTVVATGKLENYTRDGIQEALISLGAIPGSSVTKKTDFLLAGEKAGSKLAKAKELGVKVITEEEFEKMKG